METYQKIFFNSSEFLVAKLQSEILNYKITNNLYSYQLLRKHDQNSDKKNEPYYGGSKYTASQVISKLKKNKNSLTDKQLRIISENMNLKRCELLLGLKEVPKLQNTIYTSTPKFQNFFCNLMKDAFISDTYYLDVIGILKDYVPFSKKIFLIEMPNNIRITSFASKKRIHNKVFRKLLITKNEFLTLFHQTTIRLIDKINIEYFYKKNIVSNFETDTFVFFDKHNKILYDSSKVIEQYFLYCKENYFSYNSKNSYGTLLYDLLQNELSYFESRNKKLQKNLSTEEEQRLVFIYSILSFGDLLEKRQIEIDKIEKFMYELSKEFKTNIS